MGLFSFHPYAFQNFQKPPLIYLFFNIYFLHRYIKVTASWEMQDSTVSSPCPGWSLLKPSRESHSGKYMNKRINWFMADSFQVWVTLNLHTTSYKRYYFCTNQNVFVCSYVEVNWRRVIHSVCKSHLNTSYKTHILAVFLCILRRLLGQRLEKKSRRSASEEQRASLH